ncbi:MAG TPA: LuxR C-terminal-related transcriptional regulator, partial [Mycobacterium sp.]|nr:LuxR C-terminal-related transcriptional regulator [Mycobacterium sp.]
AIKRALCETGGTQSRPAILAASVEIHRATADYPAARAAADELVAFAARSRFPVLQAVAAQASGSVLLVAGDVPAALAELRTAAKAWRSLRMPHDAARATVLVGLACAALGDRASAAMEFDSAAAIFAELGAIPDLEHVHALSTGLGRASAQPGALSAREQEVLTLLAAGCTNREIAERLVVSPHTVARHIEHIYAKLGVSNRAAAAKYAFEHHLG